MRLGKTTLGDVQMILTSGREAYLNSATLAALGCSMGVIEFTPSGVILTANENFLSLTGYDLNEIQGQHHRIFLTEKDKNSSDYEGFWKQLSAGEFFSNEFKRVGKDGSEIWIRATYNPVLSKNGEVQKVVKFATDITDEKQRQSIERGKLAAIERTQAVIEFELDSTVLSANDAFLSTMGYTADEIIGQKHAMFVPSEMRQSEDYKALWADLNSGKFVSDKFRRIGKDGQDVWILGSYNPIFDPTGKIIRVVKFATDITEDVERQKHRDEAMGVIDRDLTEIAASVTQSSARSTEMARTSDQASMGVQEIAAGVEELAASAGEITQQLGRVTGVTRNAVDHAQKTSQIVSTMSEDAKSIGDVIALIQGIAEQTKLLALNATIEAARAGEAGKGFAVVASEVKELANQAGGATEEISSQISNIRNSTDLAVEAIAKIQTTISEVDEVATSVAGAVEEQTSVTSDLSASMQQISSSVSSITEGINEIAQTSETIDVSTQNLKSAASAMM